MENTIKHAVGISSWIFNFWISWIVERSTNLNIQSRPSITVSYTVKPSVVLRQGYSFRTYRAIREVFPTDESPMTKNLKHKWWMIK